VKEEQRQVQAGGRSHLVDPRVFMIASISSNIIICSMEASPAAACRGNMVERHIKGGGRGHEAYNRPYFNLNIPEQLSTQL